ncbi:MAG: DUF4058 family protein [Planctomycetaceae bacterium]
MLLDHFHPPLKGRRHWTGFHSAWATRLAIDINQQLPAGWFAEPTVHWGIEVDVAAFEEAAILLQSQGQSVESGWEPPAPMKTIGLAQTTDVVEVRIHRDFGDVPLVGAIELVSPANKDRPENRDAFVSKCDHYLRDGVGLAIVDVVTEATANLHSLLVERFGETELPDDGIYTSAYRPIIRDESQELDLWYQPLRIAGILPTMPLYLHNGPCVRIDLQETYLQVCRDLKIAD